MAYLSTELGFDTPARDHRAEAATILRRIVRRLAAMQRRSRRDRHVARMMFDYGGHILADVGIDQRKERRFDWLAALMGI